MSGFFVILPLGYTGWWTLFIPCETAVFRLARASLHSK